MGSALPARRFRRPAGLPLDSRGAGGVLPSPILPTGFRQARGPAPGHGAGNRRPMMVHGPSWNTSRAPSGHAGERRRRSGRPPPPGLWSSTARAAPRVRASRVSPHPPPSVLSVSTLSTACTPRCLPGLFHPGNALEVSPSGPPSCPGSRAPLGADCSLAVSPVHPPARRRAAPDRRATSEPSSPRRVQADHTENAIGLLPSWRSPSRALPSSPVEQDPPTGLRPPPTRP
jgi:hypothetical protein